MNTYETYALRLVPGFLRGQWGEKFIRAIGQYTDSQVALIAEAVEVRFLDIAPPDAIPYAARDSNFERYPNETDEGFLERLKLRWEAWPKAGTREGLLEQFAAYGSVPDLIEPATGGSAESIGIGTEYWSEFWLVFPEGSLPWGDDGTWDDPGEWDDGGIWDTDMPYEEMLTLTGIAHKWRPAHVVCNLVVIFEGELWDYPEGIWDEPGAVWEQAGSALYIRC